MPRRHFAIIADFTSGYAFLSHTATPRFIFGIIIFALLLTRHAAADIFTITFLLSHLFFAAAFFANTCRCRFAAAFFL